MLHGSSLAAAPASNPDLWLPVTIAVAWELALQRVRIRPELLADVREHVLRCSCPDTSVQEVEHRVPVLVEDYIQRVRSGRYARPELPPPPPLPIDPTWAPTVLDGLDPLSQAVARMHYLDRRPLPTVARQLRVHEAAATAAREGLRELVAAVVGLQGQHPDDRTEAVDAILSRLVLQPIGQCPGPLGLMTESGLRHADRCPRCSRAVRLIRAGSLAPNDLFLPDGPLVPDEPVEVLALLLHPDGRSSRRAVEGVLARHKGVPAGTDAWLVHSAAGPDLIQDLAPLCEEGTPNRHHLRGALLRGPGRWSRGVLLGPLGVAAVEAARARPWADLGGIGELPATKPPPPSAALWWAAAAASLLLTAGFSAATLLPQAPSPDTPVVAAFTQTGAGWSARFDTHDLATVDVVTLDGDELSVFRRGVRAGKGAWATGEGDFALTLRADQVAIFSSPEGLPDLETWVLDATRAPDPLAHLSAQVRAAEPRADIARSPDPIQSPQAPPTAYTAPAE